MVSINPILIQEKREHIILGFVWQVVKIITLGMINLKQHPYLIRLKEGDEET